MVVLRRRQRAIPSSDARAFGKVSLRTSAVRWTLVVAALLLLATAVASARGLPEQRSGLVPSGTSTIVVLDLSLSITDSDLRRYRRVLEQLIASRTPVGLIVFSDTPYELLPPGTPAAELRPLLPLFTPAGGRLPPNPWQTRFSAGTVISGGLDLAGRMLRRDRVADGSILLVSDLETAPSDFEALGSVLTRLRRSQVPVRLVALAPSSDAVTLFESLLGADAFVEGVESSPGAVPRIVPSLRGRTPVGLLVAGGLLFVALAAHERFAGRLFLPRESGWAP